MAATDMYMTTTGAGTKSGLSWANAMGLAEFEADIEGAAEAGDRYFIKEGTYTLTSDIISSRSGSTTALIELIGVVTATTAEPPTSSNWATGSNRPLFSHNSNVLQFSGSFWIFRNLQFETSGSSHSLSVDPGNYTFIFNCKGVNTSALAYSGIYGGSYTHVINCEGQSTNGNGVKVSTGGTIIGGYYHDCGLAGIYLLNATNLVIHNICDTCVIGINVYSTSSFLNNTIYNCTSGFAGANYGVTFYLNNAIDSCTDGFKVDAGGIVKGSTIFDYNNWSNNTRDMSWDNGVSEDNSAKGLNATAVAPAFTNAAGGDFSLDSASGLIDAGFSIELGVG